MAEVVGVEGGSVVLKLSTGEARWLRRAAHKAAQETTEATLACGMATLARHLTRACEQASKKSSGRTS